MPRIKPGAAGWEASMLCSYTAARMQPPSCYLSLIRVFWRRRFWTKRKLLQRLLYVGFNLLGTDSKGLISFTKAKPEPKETGYKSGAAMLNNHYS